MTETNLTYEEMLEIAEKREAENKALEALDKLYDENSEGMKKLAEDEKNELMKLAMVNIPKYNIAIKKLDETEKVELREELEKKKHENFQLVADACKEQFIKDYGEQQDKDSWMFMEASYFGTGEGQTVCLQLTQANPHSKDYNKNATYPDNYEAINTKEYRAVRDFHEKFGTWMLHGLRFHTREAFFEKFSHMLPPALVNLKDKQCFLEYHSELYYNFS